MENFAWEGAADCLRMTPRVKSFSSAEILKFFASWVFRTDACLQMLVSPGRPSACLLEERRFQFCGKNFKACIDASFRRHRHVNTPTGRFVDTCAGYVC
jgi:hypothetical protein